MIGYRSLLKSWLDSGNNFVFKRGTRVHLHVSDPDALKDILATKFDDYGKCSSASLLLEMLGAKGLVFAQHEEWVRQRRVVRPAFYQGRAKVRFIVMAFTACATWLAPVLYWSLSWSRSKFTLRDNFLRE